MATRNWRRVVVGARAPRQGCEDTASVETMEATTLLCGIRAATTFARGLPLECFVGHVPQLANTRNTYSGASTHLGACVASLLFTLTASSARLEVVPNRALGMVLILLHDGDGGPEERGTNSSTAGGDSIPAGSVLGAQVVIPLAWFIRDLRVRGVGGSTQGAFQTLFRDVRGTSGKREWTGRVCVLNKHAEDAINRPALAEAVCERLLVLALTHSHIVDHLHAALFCDAGLAATPALDRARAAFRAFAVRAFRGSPLVCCVTSALDSVVRYVWTSPWVSTGADTDTDAAADTELLSTAAWSSRQRTHASIRQGMNASGRKPRVVTKALYGPVTVGSEDIVMAALGGTHTVSAFVSGPPLSPPAERRVCTMATHTVLSMLQSVAYNPRTFPPLRPCMPLFTTEACQASSATWAPLAQRRHMLRTAPLNRAVAWCGLSWAPMQHSPATISPGPDVDTRMRRTVRTGAGAGAGASVGAGTTNSAGSPSVVQQRVRSKRELTHDLLLLAAPGLLAYAQTEPVGTAPRKEATSGPTSSREEAQWGSTPLFAVLVFRATLHAQLLGMPGVGASLRADEVVEALGELWGVAQRGGPSWCGTREWAAWGPTGTGWCSGRTIATMHAVHAAWPSVYGALVRTRQALHALRASAHGSSASGLEYAFAAQCTPLRTCCHRVLSRGWGPRLGLHLLEYSTPQAVAHKVMLSLCTPLSRPLAVLYVPHALGNAVFGALSLASQWCRSLSPRAWVQLKLPNDPYATLLVGPKQAVETFHILGVLLTAALDGGVERVGSLGLSNPPTHSTGLAALVRHAVSWGDGACVFGALWSMHCLWVRTGGAAAVQFADGVVGPSTPFYVPRDAERSADEEAWRRAVVGLLSSPLLPLLPTVVDSIARIRVAHTVATATFHTLGRMCLPSVRASSLPASLVAHVFQAQGRRATGTRTRLSPTQTTALWRIVHACLTTPTAATNTRAYDHGHALGPNHAHLHPVAALARAVAVDIVCWDTAPPAPAMALASAHTSLLAKLRSLETQRAQYRVHTSGETRSAPREGTAPSITVGIRDSKRVTHHDVVPFVRNPVPHELRWSIGAAPSLGRALCSL